MSAAVQDFLDGHWCVRFECLGLREVDLVQEVRHERLERVGARGEEDAHEHLAFGIVGRDARTLGIQELGKVVEDAEHALVVVEQLRSSGSAGFAILRQLLRQAVNAGVADGFDRTCLLERRPLANPDIDLAAEARLLRPTS